jgi:hypothetical protein
LTIVAVDADTPSGGDVAMGRIAKQVSETSTRYYWYPGDKAEWVRAGVATVTGTMVGTIVGLMTGSGLAAVVTGAAVLSALAGVNFGRRDARALAGFPALSDKAARRAAVSHAGKAVWRAMVEGVGAAGLAVLIANLPARGIVADWLLPIVPAVVGALAHQAGMLYERLAQVSAPVAKAPGAVKPTMQMAEG